MRVLFMGTPDFAATCLSRLLEEKDLEITVVTAPDKPQGRHMILTPSEVKKTALAAGLRVYQPQTLKNFSFANELAAVDPEIVLVVAYGKILPEYILDYPPFGCVNLHGSLLPAYRGAAPMQRAIMDGVREIGVTTMYMAKGLDTGDMLETWRRPLLDEDDLGSVHDSLAAAGAELLLSTLRKAERGELSPTAQNDAGATYAAKIEKEDCLLDFSLPARRVHDHVRALCPSPLSFAYLRGKSVKIVKTEILEEEGVFGAPGEVTEAGKGGITVACGQGKLRVLTLRPEGKKSMSAGDFVVGRGACVGDRFMPPPEG